jgi:hypothetical protein
MRLGFYYESLFIAPNCLFLPARSYSIFGLANLLSLTLSLHTCSVETWYFGIKSHTDTSKILPWSSERCLIARGMYQNLLTTFMHSSVILIILRRIKFFYWMFPEPLCPSNLALTEYMQSWCLTIHIDGVYIKGWRLEAYIPAVMSILIPDDGTHDSNNPGSAKWGPRTSNTIQRCSTGGTASEKSVLAYDLITSSIAHMYANFFLLT